MIQKWLVYVLVRISHILGDNPGVGDWYYVYNHWCGSQPVILHAQSRNLDLHTYRTTCGIPNRQRVGSLHATTHIHHLWHTLDFKPRSFHNQGTHFDYHYGQCVLRSSLVHTFDDYADSVPRTFSSPRKSSIINNL